MFLLLFQTKQMCGDQRSLSRCVGVSVRVKDKSSRWWVCTDGSLRLTHVLMRDCKNTWSISASHALIQACWQETVTGASLTLSTHSQLLNIYSFTLSKLAYQVKFWNFRSGSGKGSNLYLCSCDQNKTNWPPYQHIFSIVPSINSGFGFNKSVELVLLCSQSRYASSQTIPIMVDSTQKIILI